MILSGKTIAVGVTGGIAAYKICDVVSRLIKHGADVHVVMTDSAQKFVSPLTFETLSKNRVITKMFDTHREWEVEHISLAQKADLFLIAPCTANTAGKLAHGIADDFLSTTVMAATCPVLIAPAMNTNMLGNAAYRANEEILKSRGFIFIESECGMLACGDKGDGRLAAPETIVEAVVNTLKPRRDFAGKRILITAGATREYLDPVRYITNRSSGKMGAELARAALNRGADVTIVCGFVTVEMPKGCKIIKAETTADMYKAVLEETADYYIMAAAPCDFRPKNLAKNKIKSGAAQAEQDNGINFEFVKNPDIAAAVGQKISVQKENKTDKKAKPDAKNCSKLIIFSAETENLIENASKKLLQKNADMVVANDITKEGAGFDCDTNIVTIITRGGQKSYDKMPKSKVADVILDSVIAITD